MHFHFSNSNCSVLIDEKGPDAAASMSDTALTGCDLTLMSSTSTYSGSRSKHTYNTTSVESRKSVDAPGFIHDGDMRIHHSDSHSGSIKKTEYGSIRNEQRARMLSPSRVLIQHKPAPQWPPGRGVEKATRGHRHRAQLLSPSRVLIRHGPDPEWPPPESTSVDSQSTANNSEHRFEKENNTRVAPNQFQKQFTARHSNAKSSKIQQVSPKREQLNLYSDGNESLSSNPPPDFYPRKEIVDAIKCHEKMGKALSKLALNSEINGSYVNGDYSLTSSTLSGTSTFESFDTNSFRNYPGADRLGAQDRHRVKLADHRDDPAKQQARDCSSHIDEIRDNMSKFDGAFVGESNSGRSVELGEFSGEIEWSGSGFSQNSNRSVKSDASSFFQHVAFLEGLEVHMKELSNQNSCSDQEVISDGMIDEEVYSFFPAFDDLRSPPSSNALPKYKECHSNTEPAHPYPSLQTPNADFQDANLLSPPCTPACIHAFPCSYEQPRPAINERVLLEGIAQIKEETTTILNNMESKLNLDLKELIEKELVQIKPIASEKNHVASSALPQAGQESSPFSKTVARFSPSSVSARNAMTPPPKRTTISPLIDRNVLSEVIQKSLHSMESSILDKITLHMDKELKRDAIQQREYLEELIDEKVTKVISGQNLELQMGMSEIKRAVTSAAKQAVSRQVLERKSSDTNNTVITPAPYFTPTKCKRNDSPSSEKEELPFRALQKEPSIRVLEDSFAETMKVIDDFVADCDDLVSDFDKIAFRMEDSSVADSDLSTSFRP